MTGNMINPPIVLIGTYIVQSPYRGQSKFDFWRNLTKGDIVQVSMVLRHYITDITISYNGKKFECSATQMYNYLEKIDLIPYGSPPVKIY